MKLSKKVKKDYSNQENNIMESEFDFLKTQQNYIMDNMQILFLATYNDNFIVIVDECVLNKQTGNPPGVTRKRGKEKNDVTRSV